MTKLLPKPKEIKHSLTVQIEMNLLKMVKYEASSKGLTLRQIVEYGFKRYLEEQNEKQVH